MKRLITLELAYADDTDAAQMKLDRDAGIESKYRTESVETNLKRFDLMLRGLKEEPVVVDKNNKEEGKK